jgi:NIMA (never in mitosis gene a)-related kinase
MDDFQILSKLGEGAYSTVYKVKRITDNHVYALKKVKLMNLSEKEKENSLHDVRILASVKSNFVVSYKEAFFDEKDNTLGIVMEFADRGDLYQQIVAHKKTAKFFEESDIWRIFIQLVKGLKALHDLKILHRDMKSANVFLFSNGCAKLGDLNVSKVARRGLGYTQTGTPYYASPEVWKDKPYDHKSDVWSLGCVLYEMITLRPPFRAKDMEGLFNKVCKGQFSKIPERFSEDLFTIVKYLLQVNSIQRPSCEQILQHPIILKRIEYFKSFGNDEENEDKCLLKTIHMPKNLLFLSDKLPKPNYDKKFKINNNNNNNTNNVNDEENKNYRSFNKNGIVNNHLINYNNENGKEKINYPIYSKKPSKLIPLNNKRNNINISNIIERERENLLLNKENDKQNINILQNNKNKSYILHLKEKNLNNKSNNLVINRNINHNLSDEMLLKKDLNYIDIISKQKNDIRKLLLKKNSLINRRLNYLNNNNSQINSSALNNLNSVLIPNYNNINNKSAPKKINNYKMIKNKYYIYSPPYMKNYENLQKNPNKLNYDYVRNYKVNNPNLINIMQPHKDILPKLPRRLSPLKNQYNNKV